MSRLSFTMDAKGLRRLTSQALRTVSKHGVVQVLAGVRLSTTKTGLTLVTTDMEKAQRITTKVNAKPGSVLIPCKQLDTILSTFDGDVTVEDDGERVSVKQGNAVVSVEKYVIEDFPTVPNVDAKAKAVVVMADEFRRAYGFVRVATSKDESRPVLTGVLLEPGREQLVMAGTDSYRLAFTWAQAASVKDPWDVEQTIIQASALDEVDRLLDDSLKFVEIRKASDTMFSFSVGDIDVFARRIDGQFPNFRQLVPENYDETFEIERAPLLKTLTRVVKLTRPNVPVRLRFFEKGDNGKVATDTVTVQHIVQDSHELTDVVPMRTVGAAPKGGRQTVHYGVNPVFAKDAVAAFSTDDITMRMISPLRPVLFSGDRVDEGFLVMPIRLYG